MIFPCHPPCFLPYCYIPLVPTLPKKIFIIAYLCRASISKAIDNSDSPSKLCLTAARAVTCESDDESPLPVSRVSTRSSSILSKGQGGASNDAITPVHKIRGLVKKLAPRKRQATTQESAKTTEPEPEPQSQTEKSPPQKITLMNSLKRKRSNSSSGNLPKLENWKSDEGEPSAESKLSLSGNLSPLFPVLKLRRTAGTRNNYVAVSLHSDNSKQSEIKSNDQNPETAQESTSHKHNTRFKGQKQSGHKCDGVESRSVEKQECVSLANGESLIEVYTKRTISHSSESMLDEKPKLSKSRANETYAKRGVQPRNHNQEMRVGDIVWGKVHGHPWWPGRILGILCNASENDAGFVKVAWYGSTTTSEISCSFLMTFEENFKQLFKKQKSGAYRRAVREAQEDLQIMSADRQLLPA